MKLTHMALWAAALAMMTGPISADNVATTAPAPAADSVPKSGIEVLKLVLCKELQDREPMGEVTTAKVGDVVIGWSQIRTGLGDVSITHRWLLNGKPAADVTLPIKASPYRTWSRKTLYEAGSWTLQVLNAQGDVLKEAHIEAQP